MPRRQGLEDHAALRPRPDALPAAGQALQRWSARTATCAATDAKIDCQLACHEKDDKPQDAAGHGLRAVHNARPAGRPGTSTTTSALHVLDGKHKGLAQRGLPHRPAEKGKVVTRPSASPATQERRARPGSWPPVPAVPRHRFVAHDPLGHGPQGRRAGPGPSTIPRNCGRRACRRSLDTTCGAGWPLAARPRGAVCCPGRERSLAAAPRPPDHRLLADRQARGRALRDPIAIRASSRGTPKTAPAAT